MLANDGATVYSTDISGTQILERHTTQTFCTRRTYLTGQLSPKYYYSTSDIIISAVPSETFKVPTALIKHGAICVNVAGQNNFEEDVKTKAEGFAMRVGAITTLMLQTNALVLYDRGAI
jgi:methylenetetrahydrofolate dehydrogenase (NAD+)